ncbi:MAG: histidine kinase [Anaerocolumna sp.]
MEMRRLKKVGFLRGKVIYRFKHIPGKFSNMSLIKRMIILYLIGPILLFLSFGLTSYLIIQSILDNKMQVSIQSDLNQTMEGLDKVTNNLCGVAEQLALGEAGQNLSAIINEINPYNKSNFINNLKNEINIISFTNSDLRLFGYYNEDTKNFYYANGIIPNKFDLFNQPCLAKINKFTFYGPHPSYLKYNNDLVISVVREVPFLENNISVYVESNIEFKTTTLFLQESKFAIVNSDNIMVYNSFGDTKLKSPDLTKLLESQEGSLYNYYWKKVKSSLGYDLIIFIPKSEYNHQIMKFIMQGIFVMLLFGVLFAVTVILLWRIVIRPIYKFKKEILIIQQGVLTEDTYKTNIPEYDMLLDEFMLMKTKIQDLFIEAEQSQKQQAKMNVERLMYQINPHFLMNTLNTIHWMAVSKSDHDVDTLVMALNKLLFYNLKMDSNTSCVADEINALQQYVTLQKTRFSFESVIEVVNPRALEVKIPRFILQPLVENAIYHGVGNNGRITVKIDRTDYLEIYVTDNGEGMTQENLDNLIDKTRHISGNNEMGIGLNYVIQILKDRYGDEATIRINSYLNKGTSIHITIPVREDL